MTDYTFIKDSTLLEEDHRVEDLLDFSANINDLTEQLVRITKNSMVGLIGPYGCGKSTLLYQIHGDGKYNKDIAKDKNSGKEESVNDKYNADAGERPGNLAQVRDAMWFTFDAWKYPERKDLWDGFVIDIAMQMSDGALTEVKKEIEGTQNNADAADLKATAAVTGWIPIFGGLIEGMNEILIEGLASSPVKRVYEFHDLLKKMFSRIDKNIYIVVEDIDRSGDQGIFFLETLRHFIKNIDSKHKIIVIVPMGEEVFRKQGNNMARDSYLKVLDYQVKFNPQDIKFDKFIENVLDIDEFVKPRIGEISSQEEKDSYPTVFSKFIEHFLSRKILEDERGSIRDIKHLIRTADKKYSIMKTSGADKVEPMLILLFTATEYFHSKNGEAEKYCFQIAPPLPYLLKITHGYDNNFMYSNYWIYREILIYVKGVSYYNINYYYSKPDQDFPPLCITFKETRYIPCIEMFDISKIVDINKLADMSEWKLQDVKGAVTFDPKYLRIITGKLIQPFVRKQDYSQSPKKTTPY